MLGSACTHKILVDGEAIFGIRAGEFQALYLVPGEHTFELEIEAGICLAHSVGRSIVLSNAAETTYRIFIPSTFSMPRLETNDPLDGGTDHLPTGPTFTWDHRYSTPEAALIITEKNRVATARGTEVFYEFTARGFPTGVPAILWMKHLNSYSQLDAKVREDGVVMVIGTPKFVISEYVAGEAVDLALVLGDSRAHAKTFPFPIAAKKGDYSATVELMSDTGLLFQVTFAGFQPGEKVEINSRHKDEQRVSSTLEASVSGEVVYSAQFDRSDKGIATVAATGSSGTVSIQFQVGKKALVWQ